MRNNVSSGVTDSQCTGCGLCTKICPANAITIQNNIFGVPVRSVDGLKCVSCGKCNKMCPQINHQQLNKPMKCFAIFPQLEYCDRRYSSGGAASLIARAFMEKTGGAVCGCTWDSVTGKAKHVVVDDPEDLKAFYGSKYVQSDIEEAFDEINGRIMQKKYLLFIGTPCQVAAIQKMCASKYLLTMDLICHGTPPMTYLQDYLRFISNMEKIADVRFRGEHDFWLTAYGESGEKLYSEYKDCDPYFNAFLKGIIYRENCYSCIYARVERVSDITVGDFWELDRTEIAYNGNISLVLSNSEKGEQLVLNTANYIWLQERSLEEAIKGNLQLSAPMLITDEQKEFRRLMEKEHDFMDAFQKTFGYRNVSAYKKKWHRMMIKHRIKELIKSISHS